MLDSKSKSWPNIFKPKMLSFKSLGLRSGLPPLYLSPGLRTFRVPGSKSPADLRQTLFFSIFWPSKTSSKIRFEKNAKKMRKSRILASQNPPKILQKRLRKRRPKKHAIFRRFRLDFRCMLQEPTSKKRAPTQCFVSFSHNSVDTENLSKTTYQPSQNRYRKRVVF